MTLLTKGAAQGNEGCSPDVNSISTKGDGLGYVAAVSDSSCNYNRSPVSYPFFSQAGIHRGQGQLDGNANIISNNLGRSSRGPPQPIEDYDIRSRPDHTTGNGC